MNYSKRGIQVAVVRTVASACKLPWIFYILLTFFVLSKISYTFIVLNELRCNKDLASQVSVRGLTKRSIAGKHYNTNVKFTLQIIEILALSIIISWLYVLLVVSGDVHPNPGPLSASSSNSSLNTTYMSSSLLSSLNLSSHLSFVHYNVQSIVPKLDLLSTELFDFDILSFSETWLNPSVSLNDLHIQSFNKPERKDRVGDSHGGVLVYVKDNIHYRRRHDLEILGLENIWIELSFKHKRVLFGLFYSNSTLSLQANSDIFEAVQLFLKQTNRF